MAISDHFTYLFVWFIKHPNSDSNCRLRISECQLFLRPQTVFQIVDLESQTVNSVAQT